MQIAVAPTVFVALGGTGQVIIRKLRERIEHRVGTADLPFFRFLYLDTDQGALNEAVANLRPTAAAWSVVNVIDPAGDTLSRIRDPRTDNGRIVKALDIDSWFDKTAQAELAEVKYSQGVGGRRMYSRLGFLASQNIGSLEDALLEFYDQLKNSATLAQRPLDGIEPGHLSVVPRHVERGVRFVVVTSGGGGTGSGCVIDFGFLLRKLRKEHNWTGVHQFGMVALARHGAETPNQQRNSAALLTELDYYDKTQTYDARYLNLTSGGSFQCADPPYDAMYVVSGEQQDRALDGDRTRAFELLQWKMADFLLTDAVCVYDDEADPQRVRLPRSASGGQIAFLGDIGLNPSGLQTFGVSYREWPAALVHRRLYGAALATQTKIWTAPQSRRVAELLEELRISLGLPPATIQDNAEVRDPDDDRLKAELLEVVNDLDPVRQLHRLQHEVYNDKKQIDPEKLLDIQTRLKRLFQERAGAPTNSEQPGLITGIINTNLARCLDMSNAEGLPTAIADRLLRVCLESHGGPATAAEAARQLRSRLEIEETFITRCLADLHPTAADRPEKLEQCWQFANDRLLETVLSAKLRVYRHLSEWLERLAPRFHHFAEYLARWASQTNADGAELPWNVPSLQLPPATIQRLETVASRGVTIELKSLEQDRLDRLGRRHPGLIAELRKCVSEGLPRTDAGGRPALLAEGPPKHHGRVDYSYLDPLGRAVYESIASGEASPYRQEILALLQTEAETGGSRVPSLTEEAQLLMNFVRDTDYNTQMFSGNPTHVTTLVNPSQEGYESFEPVQAKGRDWLRRWRTAKEKIKEVSAFKDVSPDINRFTVGVVVERCSIRTDLISGYSTRQRRELFDQGHFPAASDRRIKLPPEREALQDARVLLIGSIVLRLWTYLGGSKPLHQISFPYQNDNGDVRERTVQVSNQFSRAVRKLAEEPETRKAIELKVQEFLLSPSRDNRGAAASRIETAVRAIDDLTKSDPPPPQSDLLDLNLYQVPLEDALEALMRFARRFEIPQPRLEHRYADLVRAGAPMPDAPNERVLQDSWFCLRCQLPMGVNMPIRTGQCPRCSMPYPDSRKAEETL